MKGNKACIHAFDACFFNDCMWMAHASLNKLICINLENGNIEKIIDIPFQQYLNDVLYHTIKCIDGKIWVFPGKADKIVIYDINKEHFDCISIPQIGDEIIYGLDAFVAGEWIYIIPCDYHMITRIHKNTYQVEECLDLRTYTNGKWTFVSQARQTEDGKILFTIQGNTCLFLYDIGNNQCKTIPIEMVGNQVFEARFVCKNGFVYLCTNVKNDNQLYIINIETGTIVQKVAISSVNYKYVETYGDGFVIDTGVENGFDIFDTNLNLLQHGNYQKDESITKYISIFPYGIWKNVNESLKICYNRYANELQYYLYEELKPYKVIRYEFEVENENEYILKTDEPILEDSIHLLTHFLNTVKGNQ